MKYLYESFDEYKKQDLIYQIKLSCNYLFEDTKYYSIDIPKINVKINIGRVAFKFNKL